MRLFMRSVAVLLLISAVSIQAQKQITDNGIIPFNPDVYVGKTVNDIPFYILKNSKPEKRLDLILTVNVGAVQEDADQNGLAHFCEHMAFNGTKEFPKQDLVNFLESTGIRFGADLNAYTNQDETVYMLTVPITKAEDVIKGLKVLRDWAGYVTYDTKDIEEERGVVTEEWRLGRGAEERVREKHFAAMFNGSAYQHHDVIGDTTVLLHAPPDRLRDFYRRWYRPENMAIIAVGDVNPGPLAEMIQKYFVLNTDNAGMSMNKRQAVLVPDNNTVNISIASDPELQAARVQYFVRRQTDTARTYGEFKKQIVDRLASAMINSRLSELAQKPKPPFAGAVIGAGSFAREHKVFFSQAIAADKNILTSTNALLTEIERVKRHGYTETELKRAKDELMAQMTTYYDNRSTTESSQLAQELVRHVLTQESVPGISHEMDIYRHYVAGITAAECQQSFAGDLTEKNQMILISVPEGNGYTMPKEQQVKDLLAAVKEKKIDAYVDNVPTKPLMATIPTAGSIVKQESVKELGAQRLTLSNGATVYLKKTEFKTDEILVDVRGFGGQSLGKVQDHITLSNAATVVDASGIADLSATDLQKVLQGKSLGLSPFIQMESQGLSGQTSPRDLETFMQILNLYFTAPRVDADAVSSWKSRTSAMLANKEKSPEGAMFDTVMFVMSDRHPRAKPLDAQDLDKFDPALALKFYKERFANAAGFTFTFVGNFDENKMQEYVKTYIASLPGDKAKAETWKDAGINMKRGKVDKTVLKGSEPKSFVALMYSGPVKYTPDNRYDVIALCEVMNIRLREQMREEASGVYFVSVQPNIEKIPHEEYGITVIFSCSPDRVDELVAIVEKEAEYMRKNTVAASYIQKVKEIQAKEREVSKNKNSFWSGVIPQLVQNGEAWSSIARRDELIAALNADQVKAAAVKYLDAKNFARFVLKPEKGSQ